MKEFYNLNTLPDITLPVRCFTCNKVLSNMFFKWMDVENEIKNKNIKFEGVKNKYIMDKIGLKMTCCQNIVLSHAEYKLDTN